jgi:dihydropyrimidinase
MTTLIKNGTVVTATDIYNADILIKSGLITEIGKDIAKITEEVVDATDKYVFPGGVDVHTHLDVSQGDLVSADDFESGTTAATYGGTTTVINYAEQLPRNTLQESIEVWQRKAEGKAVIDYGLHMVVREYRDGALDEIPALIRTGITSFKCSLANRDNGLIRDSNVFMLLQKLREHGGLLCVHGENGEIIKVLTRRMLEERKVDPKYHALSRPPELEGEATGRAIMLAELLKTPIYIVSLSAAHALEKVKAARDRGNPIYAETCPQYLLLSADSYEAEEFNGAKYVCTPPLRPKWHQEILWKGLSSGDLQVVASDHCAFNFRGQKDVGREDFSKIPSGLPAIEHRLQLLYSSGVLTGKISLNKLVDLLATAPAKLFGLFPKKGTIAIGSDADLVVFDPNTDQKISAETHHMRVDYNPFEGFSARGGILAVMSKGVIIVRSGKFVGKPGAGELIRRKPFTIQ